MSCLLKVPLFTVLIYTDESNKGSIPFNRLQGINMKFLKLTQVINLTGLSRSSIYQAIAEGRFPKQISLGARSVAFVDTEIAAWMEACVAKSRGGI